MTNPKTQSQTAIENSIFIQQSIQAKILENYEARQNAAQALHSQLKEIRAGLDIINAQNKEDSNQIANIQSSINQLRALTNEGQLTTYRLNDEEIAEIKRYFVPNDAIDTKAKNILIRRGYTMPKLIKQFGVGLDLIHAGVLGPKTAERIKKAIELYLKDYKARNSHKE